MSDESNTAQSPSFAECEAKAIEIIQFVDQYPADRRWAILRFIMSELHVLGIAYRNEEKSLRRRTPSTNGPGGMSQKAEE